MTYKKIIASMNNRTREAEAECSRIQGELMQEPLSSLLLEKSSELHRMIKHATANTFRELDFRARSWSSSADLRCLSQQLKNLKGRIKILHKFLNAGYGTLVKQKLVESGHLCSIISFDCEKDIFPDATTSVGIILYDKAVYHIAVQFFHLQSIDELAAFESLQPVAEVPRSALDSQAKWLPHFQGTAKREDHATHRRYASTHVGFGAVRAAVVGGRGNGPAAEKLLDERLLGRGCRGWYCPHHLYGG